LKKASKSIVSRFIDGVRGGTGSLCAGKGFLCGDKEVNVI